MRVAIVTPGFSADESDWCIPVLRDLVEGLSKRHEVTVVALRYPHSTEAYRAFGADILPIGGATVRGVARLRFLRDARTRILEVVRDRSIEVLHGVWAHEPGALVVNVGRKARVPTLVSLFGGELANLPRIGYGGKRSVSNRLLVSHALRHADRVSVGSRQQKQQALDSVEEERIVSLDLAADRRLFTTQGSLADSIDGDPALVSVGSLVPVKGHETILEALAQLTNTLPKARLHLFGKGESEPSLRRLTANLEIEHRVEFHGEVDHHELPAIFRRADLHVLGSHFESGPMVVMEALSCGCPTVGTRVGVVEELAGATLPVPIADSRALARGIEAALEPSRLAELREQCNVLANERTVDHSVDQLASIYQGLLDGVS